MGKGWLWLILVVLSIAPLHAGPDFERTAGRALNRVITVQDRNFNRESVSAVARQFVKEVSERYGLAVLDIRTLSSRRALEFYGSTHGLPFEDLVAASKEAASKPFNVARVIVWEGAATLQMRFASGRVEEVELGTASAASLGIGGLSLRLLEFRILRPALLPPWEFFQRGEGGLELWCRVPRVPSAQEAMQIWERLRRATPNLFVHMRPNGWWENGLLPLTFPFEDPKTITYLHLGWPWAAIHSRWDGVQYTVRDGPVFETVTLIPPPKPAH